MFLKWVQERPPQVAKERYGEKVVYFVRHGQSVANLVDFKDKQDEKLRDAGLTDKGKEQARRLQERVAEWGVQTVICSPLTRTIQTACLAFEKELRTPIISWPEVAEYYGELPECQGRPLSVLREDPQLLELKRFSDVSLAYIDAPEDVAWWHRADDRGRLARFLSWLSNAPETRIAVVTHWGFIRLLMDYVNCSEELELKNCTFVGTLWKRSAAVPITVEKKTAGKLRLKLKKPERHYGVVLVPAASTGADQQEYGWVPPLLSELNSFFREAAANERFAGAKSLRAGGMPYCTLAAMIPFATAEQLVMLQELLATTITAYVMKRRDEGEPAWHPDAPGDSIGGGFRESLHLRSAGHNLALFYGLFFESTLLTLLAKSMATLSSYVEAPHALRHHLYHLTLFHDNRTEAQVSTSELEALLSSYPTLRSVVASAGGPLPSAVAEQLASIRWEVAVVSTVAGDWDTFSEVGSRMPLY
mmetsp:Transcript_1339/g.4822  ORF Transcript_1339/g.4822 Transcript_1339/m.4822 type:complete len:475 (+) Transcript_1339:147-1571(+)|eukprot:CAMPEP_0114623992 /NCGR_PEP_ID=MMETSP0168-20121206/10536_1 /TAXON_ID=95228 ORGANISM="Vannella sp., Strain DIVA3 517/6/12" /NCGR_SAMPLE_ID=MMETSP0168 /ASSEMBLY_ACC=CAM_ASM_000044 /LENGTH=474 /DNA_ID=CAMNT_0001835251 /DNA_START=100 /DNA_END=1524 /DNA_ORIENTATION=+